MRSRRVPVLIAFGLLAGGACAQGDAAEAELPATGAFRRLATFAVKGGIAEIVAASPDGRTLAFSDARGGRVGFVDLREPSLPVALPDVVTGGEPTSVSWHGDVVVAAVVAHGPEIGAAAPDPTVAANAGALVVIDASVQSTPKELGRVAIGHQPDSVALLRRGADLVAIVCIENQPIVVDKGGVVLEDDRPGYPTGGASFPQDRSAPGLVQVVTLDLDDVAASRVVSVPLPAAALTAAGLRYPDDPQPEFVAVHGDTAAVTLQENNGMALLDLRDPAAPTLVRVFSTGNASERRTDLTEDEAIDLAEGYPSSIGTRIPAPTDGGGAPVPGGPRQPDAIAWSADGAVLYTADEGELDLTGGRGISAWSRDGEPVWDDAGELERAAAAAGLFPEHRAANRGIEMEGIATGRFGDREFAFALSERGSFVAVCDLADPRRPRLVELLPTGDSPEGVVAIPQRDLVVTADEGAGALTIFRWVRPR
ncbi:MAG: hypothetical protein AB7O97_16320 [Planctomycetota bacterium]